MKVHLDIKKAGRRGELATYTQTEDITEGNLSIDKDDSVCWQYVRHLPAFILHPWGWVRKLKNQKNGVEGWVSLLYGMSQPTVWYESASQRVSLLYAMKLLRLIWLTVLHGMSQSMYQYTLLYESANSLVRASLLYGSVWSNLLGIRYDCDCLGGQSNVFYESAYSMVLWFIQSPTKLKFSHLGTFKGAVSRYFLFHVFSWITSSPGPLIIPLARRRWHRWQFAAGAVDTR